MRPLGAEVVAGAVRRRGPDQLWQRLGQAPPAVFAFAQRLLGAAPLDGDRHRARGDVHDAQVMRGRLPGLPVIHGKGAQDLSAAGKDRRRPAGAQAVRQRQVGIGRPQGIAGDVRGEDGLAPVGGRAARAHGGTDSYAVDRLDIRLRQARRRPVSQMNAVGVEKQNRGQHLALGQLLNRATQERQDRRERFTLNNPFQNALLAV